METVAALVLPAVLVYLALEAAKKPSYYNTCCIIAASLATLAALLAGTLAPEPVALMGASLSGIAAVIALRRMLILMKTKRAKK